MNEACNGTFFWAKRSNIIKYHLISITKSISNIFNQTLCVFSHERYKTYQTGSSFGRLGHAPGWDLGVPWGGGGLGMSIFYFKIHSDLVCELLT